MKTFTLTLAFFLAVTSNALSLEADSPQDITINIASGESDANDYNLQAPMPATQNQVRYAMCIVFNCIGDGATRMVKYGRSIVGKF